MHDELTPISQLGQALAFSHDDLRANRDGRVTRRQRRVLWRRFWGGAIIFALLLLVPIGIAVLLVAWGTEQGLMVVLFNDEALIGYAVGALSAMFYVATTLQSFLLAPDLVRGRVLAITGPVERYGRYLYMGQQRFLLGPGDLELVQSELHYTLYFLPTSQFVLSMEFAE